MSSSESDGESSDKNRSWAEECEDLSGKQYPDLRDGMKNQRKVREKRKSPVSYNNDTKRARSKSRHSRSRRSRSRDSGGYHRRRSHEHSQHRERTQSRSNYSDHRTTPRNSRYREQTLPRSNYSGYRTNSSKCSVSSSNKQTGTASSSKPYTGKAKKNSPAKPKDQSKFKMQNYLDKIDNKNEKHIWITDMKISEEMQATAPELDIISMPQESMEELTAAVKDLIINNDETRPTFITVSIFSRHYSDLNTIGCENIANEISHCAKDGNGNKKRNIHITLSTVDYKPGYEHLWVDIEETNHYFKQRSISFSSLPFNLHRWLLRPALNNRTAREVRGSFYEEYVNKENLGLTLNDDGKQKVLEGLLRHHASFTEPMGEINRIEAKPIPLNQTRGFKLEPFTATNAWLNQHIGHMEGRILLEEQQRANRLALVTHNNDAQNIQENEIANNIIIQEQDPTNNEVEEGEIVEEQNPAPGPSHQSTPPRKIVSRKRDLDSSSDDSSSDESSSDDSEEKAATKSKIKALEIKVELFQNMLNKKDKEITYLEKEMLNKDREIEKKDEIFENHAKSLEDISADIQKAKANNAKLKDQLSSYEQQYHRDKNTIKDSNDEKVYLMKRLDVQNSAIKELENQNIAFKKELAIKEEIISSLKKQNNLQEKKNQKEK